MRFAVGLVLLACVSGCTSGSVFACAGDSECDLGGTPGYCDAPGYCSFDDAACPSGRRFGSLAGMGLADECVSGEAGSTGSVGSTSSVPSTMGPTTTLDPTTGGPESGSSETGTPPATTTGSADESSSTGSTPSCTVYDFERDPGFVDQGIFVDVVYDGGQMLVEWDDAILGSAALGIASGVDVTGGSIETEFATLPTEQGTLLSIRWEDTSGRIVSADVDGPSYLVGYFDPSLPEGMQNSILGNTPHMQRPILRMREDGGTVVVEAADAEDTEEIGIITEPFDPVGVEVWMIFNRYQSDGVTTRIALETITTCE